jgi:dipeptidyl-peptidase-4
VSASGGRTRWAKVPGDPRNIYIPRIGWADAENVILQQMDRLQHTNNIWLANAKNGDVRLLFRDRDDAWVDVTSVAGDAFAWLGAPSSSSRRQEAPSSPAEKSQSLLTSAATPNQ